MVRWHLLLAPAATPTLQSFRGPQAAVDKGCFRAKRATKDGPPALPVVLAAAADIAAAMAYLHGRGVVHGDLAGGNVLLCTADAPPHGFTCKVGFFW
jgi:Protein tyrosine and serine/threonine kinase